MSRDTVPDGTVRCDGRDAKGRFVEGNEIGKDTRLAPGYEGGPGGPTGNTKRETHGVYSYQERGELPEARKTPAIVSRVDEIRRNVATADGLEREQEKLAEKALVALDLALSWVKTQKDAGHSLDGIKVFRMIPALLNSAGRALSQSMEMKEKLGKVGPNVIDAAIAEAEKVLADAD
jgi:hypothetical protein